MVTLDALTVEAREKEFSFNFCLSGNALIECFNFYLYFHFHLATFDNDCRGNFNCNSTRKHLLLLSDVGGKQLALEHSQWAP